MTDNNNIEIKEGDSVNHRFRNYPIGKISKIQDGCNAVCWVDFGEKILNKTHLTICTKDDLIKIID